MNRNTVAITLLGLALAIQVIILSRGEETAGWAIAGIVLLAAAVASLLRPSGKG